MTTYQHRYTEGDGTFYHRSWRVADTWMIDAEVRSGPIEDRPPWLTDIINVAKLSGNFMRPMHPPPDAIVWFETDEMYTLMRFQEFQR